MQPSLSASYFRAYLTLKFLFKSILSITLPLFVIVIAVDGVGAHPLFSCIWSSSARNLSIQISLERDYNLRLSCSYMVQVLAAAQAGKHNEKRESYGDAMIIDPWGEVIARLPGTFILVCRAHSLRVK